LESSKAEYDNVEVRHGDGTLGWADAAPFDAILVAAGGPEIPEALRSQLKIGGRLIIPIGELGGTQELVKVVRDSGDHYHEEDLGPVAFVPLLGARGWAESTMNAAPASARLWPRRPHGLSGVSPVMLGSETLKVLTQSKIPVLVYR
jgi:protein-L-isoaspartate(D-aspartate) O-methyltransferase (PCMT)